MVERRALFQQWYGLSMSARLFFEENENDSVTEGEPRAVAPVLQDAREQLPGDDGGDYEENDGDGGEDSGTNHDEWSDDGRRSEADGLVHTMRPLKLKMTSESWDVVESAVRQTLAATAARDAVELTPRVPDHSAALARYNPDAHFAFQSPPEATSVPPLDHALTACRLRQRPLDRSDNERAHECFENGSAEPPRMTQRPFEIALNGTLNCIDVDGDVIAVCGDSIAQNTRSYESFVATTCVRRATNLGSALALKDVLVMSPGGGTVPLETAGELDKLLFRSENRSQEYFTKCIVDAVDHRVWALSSLTGTVHGFSTADGNNDGERRIGLLAFNRKDIRAQEKQANSRYGLSRCGDDYLIGTAATNRLSVWKVSEALEKFQNSSGKELSMFSSLDSPSDSPEGEGDGEEFSKRQRSLLELPPRMILVEDPGRKFRAGETQWVMDSQILIGSSQVRAKPRTCAVRLFDISAESIVGLYCGIITRTTIDKQHCVSHGLLFASSSTGQAFAWDVRTGRPAFLLRGDAEDRVLGVPGAGSGCVAFTYGAEQESIKCWDLRRPASHAYTMATGNNRVRQLHWHASSASLLANTFSHPGVPHARFGSEKEGLDGYCDHGALSDGLPRRAQHDRSYFGPDAWQSTESQILQYSFENGRSMSSSS
eukprot:CAMPEP_0184717350 /NCGR_PEP_ID=MMETSP0314-20130426/6843_1 /TAXON_ID=38298 /ORGANISM="Rhodella maculata, Strain CCMP 736" /LENGTH=656 /DNA_ID=CAMNT_0027180897 /DNA_START=108 /DNA_END=2078 /DNA_ORIENTATION=-